MLPIVALLACAPQPDPAPPQAEAVTTAPDLPRTGAWRAWLDSAGGELPFGLDLSERDGHWQAWLLNGPERTEIDAVRVEGSQLVFDITHYDATVHATWSDAGEALEGAWRKTGRASKIDTLPFHATWGRARRFSPGIQSNDDASVSGRWRVDFGTGDDAAIGQFEQGPGIEVNGTFLTTVGDHRFLEGTLEDRLLRLSVFDGAHAFLYQATLQQDGSLRGEFWSGSGWHETWTATRDDTVRLPDPLGLTRVDETVDWSALVLPDTEGVQRALDDPAWSKRPHLIQIMGTWCPNCNDQTAHLVALRKRYGDRLAMVSLAFEHTGDLARDTAIIRRYRAHHGADWTYLVAGLSDKKEASKTLPFLDRVRAYPTLLFVDEHGAVQAIHTGFTGPAAPEEYARLQATYTRLIDTLLDPDD